MGSPLTAEGQGGGPVWGGLQLLHRFTAEIDDPELPFRLTMTVGARDRRLVVEQVTIAQRDGGQAVTSAGLRLVRVDAYLAAVRQNLGTYGGAFLLAQVRDRTESAVSWGLPSKEALERFEDGQRGSLTHQELLALAAHHYQEALASSDPKEFRKPTEAVAKRLHCTRGHASRLLSEARRTKPPLLGPAFKGRPGEDGTPARKTKEGAA